MTFAVIILRLLWIILTFTAIVFYGVYSEAGVPASKAPIDADSEKLWVSKIDLNAIVPPVSVTSLLHILNMKERITDNTSPQLLTQDGLTPLDDQIFTKDGNWLGASAEDHLVLKFKPPFEEGSRYRIQNCFTGNSLAIQHSRNVQIASAGYFDDDPWNYVCISSSHGFQFYNLIHFTVYPPTSR